VAGIAAFVVGLCMVPLSNAQALDSSCLARTETTTQHRPFFHRVGVVSPVVNVDFLLIEYVRLSLLCVPAARY
jgi:hypothetical protein